MRQARWAWWAVAAAIALLATSQWLHAPSVEYLVSLIVATVVSTVAIGFVSRSQRWWAFACAVSLAVAAALATPAERTLWRVQHQWEDWRRDAARQGLAELRQALDAALASSARMVHDALSAPTDTRSNAFDALDRIAGTDATQGLVLFQADTALAWSGTTRAPVDAMHDGIAIVPTPFYLALQIADRRENLRAVGVILLDAAPPADRLASTITESVAKRSGLHGFNFSPASDSASGEVLRYAASGSRLFDVRAISYQQGETAQRAIESVRARAGVAFVIALVCFIIGVWRGTRSVGQRLAALAVGLGCTALVPLSQYSNLTRLFDPAVYFTPKGGPLTGNAGALAATSALALLFILALFGRKARRVSRWTSIAMILLVAGLGPFLLRDLARGVQAPVLGVDTMLWLIWEVPLFLAAVSVLLLGASAGANVLGSRRGLPPWVAPTIASVAGMLAPVVWDAPGRWPWWYAPIWILAIAMLALSRRSRFVILSASTVAAVGATTLVWGRAAKGRVDAAERDLVGLSRADSVSVALLRRFGLDLQSDIAPISRQALLRQYVVSDIASAGNPIDISAWPTDSGPVAEFKTSDIPAPRRDIERVVGTARRTGMVIIEPVPTDTALELVMAAPSITGGVTAAVLAPKSLLFDPDPFVRLVGLESDLDVEPPYTVRLREGAAVVPDTGRVRWRRFGSELHGDWNVPTGKREVAAHVEVDLRSLDGLLQRGALVVLLDLTIVGLLWFASVVADGGAGRWLRARRRTWGRSFRARLSLALFAFFVIPALAFAVWSYSQLATDATQSRALLVSETLRALAQPTVPTWLPTESDRLDTPLLLYRGGELLAASDALYQDLAPIGRFLPGPIELTLTDRSEETTTSLERVDGGVALFGYRAFATANGSTVVAAPARSGEVALGRRRRDLSVLVLFATAVGALAALWLSGIAARQLARPIGTLRNAALSIAGGARTPPLETEPTVEFHPVFAAFRRMAADLNASRTALEEAQRRTAAVLRNVASGVVAVDTHGHVLLANPRAETLLATSLAPGAPFDGAGGQPVSDVVRNFLASDREDEDFALTVGSQQLRGTLTRLGRGGAVVTIDDVTELARAQRVLAWGEMARQVAHEIKNPLTPIRLGVQHLKRARADSRVDFDRVLDQNVNQILAEIDRLDEIARAFSRYGAAPDERARAAPVDVAAAVREVVALERMGEEKGPTWTEEGTDAPVLAMARADELKEVLLNVLENARHAGASRVVVRLTPGARDDGLPPAPVAITVRDNGQGIASDVLPRIFEPHFSTRTSGSGLGLAISRQLVEGWGGTIRVESEPGQGAAVTIELAPPDE